MRYFSTNNNAPAVTLTEAVFKGLAPDRGLYMPEHINRMPDTFFENISNMSFQEIACHVADCLFAEDIQVDDLHSMVCDTLSFNCPIVKVYDNIWSLELFHGPTLAFKDVGARFMARMLSHIIRKQTDKTIGDINVLVATSGDTGSAVANGFFDVDGVNVYVLYPKGKVSKMQENQFATLGHNIMALEVEGTFDDCQALVKEAFADTNLNKRVILTSANSINVARLLPQTFYYFNAYAQIKKLGLNKHLVVSVPSGNLGNLAAGLIAKHMGLPVSRFIAANNANDVFFKYLKTGIYSPRHSILTIANAMDVGAPSNFARIISLYENSYQAVTEHVSGATYNDTEIEGSMSECYKETEYILDPHGACAWRALKENLHEGETGIFLETAHPAKFKPTVEKAIGTTVNMPQRLAAYGGRQKMSRPISNSYDELRSIIESNH